MPSRGTQRPGPPGVCGNTLAMVNAVCDREACFRSRWPMFEKPSATFFAATTPRCKHSGERTRGILRDNDSGFAVAIKLRTVVPTSALALYLGLSPKSTHSQTLLQIRRGYFYKCRFALVSHLPRIA